MCGGVAGSGYGGTGAIGAWGGKGGEKGGKIGETLVLFSSFRRVMGGFGGEARCFFGFVGSDGEMGEESRGIRTGVAGIVGVDTR